MAAGGGHDVAVVSQDGGKDLHAVIRHGRIGYGLIHQLEFCLLQRQAEDGVRRLLG